LWKTLGALLCIISDTNGHPSIMTIKSIFFKNETSDLKAISIPYSSKKYNNDKTIYITSFSFIRMSISIELN
jgi:hypothetical protein